MHWGRERPDRILAAPLHSKKVTVRAAVRRGQKPIGTFFFAYENEATVTVSSETYMKVALKPFWRVIGERRDIERDTEWFQQDGAALHISQDS